jgi:ribonuclease HII
LVDFGIGHVTVDEINKKGIDDANREAFYRAWNDLIHEPNFLLVDGDKPAPAFVYNKQKNAPKADAKWWPVSAASVIAKVIRDEYMDELGDEFPHFLWEQNAGYGSKDHRNALRAFGPSPLHRQQFIGKIMGSPHED